MSLPADSRPGRTVLVTGASSGIGRAVAMQQASRGEHLELLARHAGELERAARAARHQGSRAVVVTPADVSDTAAVTAAFDDAVGQVGPIDAVVHAAGVAAYGRFGDIPAATFDRVLAVNVSGTANVARCAFDHFDQHDLRGDLELIGSVVGRISTPTLSPYVASKWAVHGLARTLQAEQGALGHHVSLVEPGGVSTSIYEKAASYLGVQGKPPPPVSNATSVAAATVALLDDPRRERSVGALNPLMSFGFRALPAVYDRIVGPLMSRLALADEHVPAHDGNLFTPLPEPDAGTVPLHAEEYV